MPNRKLIALNVDAFVFLIALAKITPRDYLALESVKNWKRPRVGSNKFSFKHSVVLGIIDCRKDERKK